MYKYRNDNNVFKSVHRYFNQSGCIIKYQGVFLGKCYDRGCFSFQSTIEKNGTNLRKKIK